jgi:hypothetical protein
VTSPWAEPSHWSSYYPLSIKSIKLEKSEIDPRPPTPLQAVQHILGQAPHMKHAIDPDVESVRRTKGRGLSFATLLQLPKLKLRQALTQSRDRKVKDEFLKKGWMRRKGPGGGATIGAN